MATGSFAINCKKYPDRYVNAYAHSQHIKIELETPLVCRGGSCSRGFTPPRMEAGGEKDPEAAFLRD